MKDLKLQLQSLHSKDNSSETKNAFLIPESQGQLKSLTSNGQTFGLENSM